MEASVDVLEPRLIHPRVDLRGHDAGVPEEFLHHAQVRPAGEEVGGEGVPEQVGVGAPDADGLGVALDDLPDRHSFEGSPGS